MNGWWIASVVGALAALGGGCETGTAPPAGAAARATTGALAAGVSVGARILVITADGSDPALAAIQQTLDYLGTPYDVLNATTGAPLTAATLATGSQGKYQAVFVDVGDLSVGGTSAFTTDEWNTLEAYEAQFGVRRVSLNTTPSADYGLASAGTATDGSVTPITTYCTGPGATVFVGANCSAQVMIDSGLATPSRATDASTQPLLTDAAGNVYAALRTNPDGREAVALTFAQSSTAIVTLELAYGLVSWATRGLFLGERHVYLVPQLDDLFLASSLYPDTTGLTYRISDVELQELADWQATRQSNPLLAGFRLSFALNAQGSGGVTADPLTAKAVALGPKFAWINHTWDHTDLTTMVYNDVLTELSLNDQAINSLGLTPYAKQNLVTPGITGLANPDAMKAAYDFGIRYLVSDTSVAGENNPSPNAGIMNALQPGILEIPRIPTDLDYDLSQPSEWIAYWTAIFGQTLTYPQIVAAESKVLLLYLLTGNNDPMMFHQANVRDIGSAHSMLTDLLGATLDSYLAVATFPVVSPTMDDLAQRVLNRMAFNASGVSATITPGSQITVQVTNAATIPVTGLCTPTSESYAGQKIAYVQLPAGGSTTLSLTNCTVTTDAGADGGADSGAHDPGSTDAGKDASGPAAAEDQAGAGGCGCITGGGSTPAGALGSALACALIVSARRRRARR